MKNFKRIMAGFLTLVMLFSILPLAAFASETDEQATVDTGDVTIEGTNSFGTLLSEEITQEQESAAAEEELYEGGYSVTDLVIEGNTATVTYDSLDAATLVVALYSEDGMQMLTSGTTAVTADAAEATVTFEGDMPEYFLASAYLLDTYDLSPLCAAYDTPMYTQEMQELLASTVSDYDADRVLNLDDDDSTNFAVYAETTKVIEYTEGTNTVATADDETKTYVIENADEQFTALEEGDVFVYTYGENEMLIAKVAAIAVDGTTVTITGDKIEIREVFSQMKIEGSADSSTAIVDEDSGDEGVTLADSQTRSAVSLADYSGTESIDIGLQFEIEKEFPTSKESLNVVVTGTVDLSITGSLGYYISDDRFFLNFNCTNVADISVEISDELEATIKLKEFMIPIGSTGILYGLKPEIKFECGVGIEISGILTQPIIVTATSLTERETYFNHAKWEWKTFDVSGEFSITFNAKPTVCAEANFLIAKIELVKLQLSVPISVKITFVDSSIDLSKESLAEVVHSCEKCIGISVDFTITASIKLTFLESESLSVSFSLPQELKIALGDFYYSIDHGEFGFNACPYKKYLVTVEVLDEHDNALPSALVSISKEQVTTGENGCAQIYVAEGTHTIEVSSLDVTNEKTLYIDCAQKVSIGLFDKSAAGEVKNILGNLPAANVVDESIVASGKCGDDVYWILYGNGLLDISGNGAMIDYVDHDSVPWFDYREIVTDVQIGEGVTALGSYAFAWCSSMTQITISDSVASIGEGTFQLCNSLLSISIPDSVASIGSAAFYGCGITSIVIPDGVKSIEDGAFSSCTNLTDVTIPDSVTSIGYGAFWFCDSLSNIDIPNSVVSIGGEAFYGCALTSIVIPDGVKSIERGTFAYCTNLTDVTIPSSVTSIGDEAFLCCYELTKIDIPNSVTSIGKSAFCGCSGLTELVIPDSVTRIGTGAFSDCMGLTSITLSENLTSIGEQAFFWCSALESVTIPASVGSIGDYAFYYCTALETITFEGDAPVFETSTEVDPGTATSTFTNVTATAYYPANNGTWDGVAGENYGGTLTWVASGSTQTSTAAVASSAANVDQDEAATEALQEETVPEETVVLAAESDSRESATVDQVYGGAYSTEVTDTYTLKTASFTGLVPGEDYVLLAMVSITTSDPLAANNLLFVAQDVALDDGTLSFQYVQREATDTSYVMACGASNKNLADAAISFPEMTADGELQVVDPEVVYDGVTLTEGQDYTIIGTVEYTEAGTYTCYIRGIHNYTGLVECTYTVTDNTADRFNLTGSMMTLGGSLAINFLFNASSLEGTDNYAVITKSYADGTTKEVTLAQADWSVYGVAPWYYITFNDITAKEMNDQVTVVIYNADGQQMSNTYVDSVASYCSRMAAKELTADKPKVENIALYVDMLNYGAAAQVYFGYDAENLASSVLTEELQAYATTDVTMKDKRQKGTGYYGSSLLLESEIKLNYVYYNSTIDKAAYAVASFTNHYGVAQNVTIQAKDFHDYGEAAKYITVTGMGIADCYQDVTVVLYDAEDNVLSTTVDSVESYIARMSNADALYIEIMQFAVSAYNYFH